MRGSRPEYFFRGGGGRPDGQKAVWTRFFFFFFSPQRILQFTEGVQWFYHRENYTFPRIQMGLNIFQGRPTYQILISIETHITCDFPGVGEVRTPYPSLDPHM